MVKAFKTRRNPTIMPVLDMPPDILQNYSPSQNITTPDLLSVFA
jgi:hypothetical protein